MWKVECMVWLFRVIAYEGYLSTNTINTSIETIPTNGCPSPIYSTWFGT